MKYGVGCGIIWAIGMTNDEEVKDYTWRKDNAVLGYLLSSTQYDMTGDLRYYYEDEVKVTHKEEF